jgi:1-deoxy-D-xylulose-5-phosphate synthase
MLKDIKSPEDIKSLSDSELETLAFEIRKFLIESVSRTGGHLASNLGVVELTLALHSVFDFSEDRLIWDVGHQSYVHKILTGRMDKFPTLRKFGGISGFPKTSESIYDAFNTGHASTSASSAMGMARARDLSGDNYEIVSVFGDGALTGGMMFEALNDAGHSKSKVIFILNDNNMSISQNVGAISGYLQKLRVKPEYYKSKDFIEELFSRLPFGSISAANTAKRAKSALRKRVIPTTLFDNLGLNYIGPVDGHNITSLKAVLDRAKKSGESSFIHIRTVKGKGYRPAENNPEQYHGISAVQTKSCDFAEVFGKKLVSLAKENRHIVAITAAMPANTGLLEFANTFKKRYFDVGIAEEHAVTMAAGLSISGYVPVLPIYSTFLQRAYDQILHDVCLQNLHVVFCAEHAGIVGEDGETHHGMYDIAFLSQMPNMTLLSPSSFEELKDMLEYAVNTHSGPIAIRYPKGASQVQSPKFEFGKAQLLSDGKDILIISAGRMIKTAKKVAEHFGAQLISLPTIKPLDKGTIIDNAKSKKLIVTIEDAAKSGGINSIISCALTENSVNTPLLPFAFPDEPIVHGTIGELDRFYGMDENSIINRIEERLNDF